MKRIPVSLLLTLLLLCISYKGERYIGNLIEKKYFEKCDSLGGDVPLGNTIEQVSSIMENKISDEQFDKIAAKAIEEVQRENLMLYILKDYHFLYIFSVLIGIISTYTFRHRKL